MHATKSLLAHLCRPGSGRGFSLAALVGAGSYDSHRHAELVDRLSQRLVLGAQNQNGLENVCGNFRIRRGMTFIVWGKEFDPLGGRSFSSDIMLALSMGFSP
jgi:hypothetical protein